MKTGNPEVKLLAVLAKKDGFEAVKTVVNQVQSSVRSDFAESRYFEQLRIFVQLRNSVEQQFEKVMESVAKFFKEENDFLFKRGELKGEAKGELKGEAKKGHVVVENLITELGLSDEQAARIAEVSIDFVKNVRSQLKK